MGKTLTVKIKSAGVTSWYKEQVGSEFKVTETGDPQHYLFAYLNIRREENTFDTLNLKVLKSDCIVISTILLTVDYSWFKKIKNLFKKPEKVKKVPKNTFKEQWLNTLKEAQRGNIPDSVEEPRYFTDKYAKNDSDKKEGFTFKKHTLVKKKDQIEQPDRVDTSDSSKWQG